VHGEVIAPNASAISFAKLARAVKRINDPDPVGTQST
jgi:hypothetical protein